jgi:hypothetical protein
LPSRESCSISRRIPISRQVIREALVAAGADIAHELRGPRHAAAPEDRFAPERRVHGGADGQWRESVTL